MRSRRFVFAVALLATVFFAVSAEAQRRGRGLGNALRGAGNAVGVEMPGEITRSNLTPSQVGDAWAPLDEENPLTGDDAIDYAVTPMDNYSQFFLSVARLQGTLALAQNTVDLLNTTIDETLPAVFTGEILTEIAPDTDLSMEDRRALFTSLIMGNFSGAQGIASGLTEDRFNQLRDNFHAEHPEIETLRTYIPLSIEGLTSIPDQASGLVSQGQGLVGSASSDFAGTNAILIPDITSELSTSMNTLSEIPGDASDLLSSLRELAR